jgi:hypothetical protein
MITTKGNIDERMNCILASEMPKTFRDAVELCRELHIPYLWIDVLCIIQPHGDDADDEDWQDQRAVMGNIYAQAILIIAATNASSVDEGCFTAPSSKLDVSPEVCSLFPDDAFQSPVVLSFIPNGGRLSAMRHYDGGVGRFKSRYCPLVSYIAPNMTYTGNAMSSKHPNSTKNFSIQIFVEFDNGFQLGHKAPKDF